MKEHNRICDELHDAYPSWSSDALYHQARLINAALMAKIHALEWTPAILRAGKTARFTILTPEGEGAPDRTPRAGTQPCGRSRTRACG